MLHKVTIKMQDCPGISSLHFHEYAQGSRKVGNDRVKLAKAAGHYLLELCITWSVLACQYLVSQLHHSQYCY